MHEKQSAYCLPIKGHAKVFWSQEIWEQKRECTKYQVLDVKQATVYMPREFPVQLYK